MQVTIETLGLAELELALARAAELGFGGELRVGNTTAVPYAKFVHDGAKAHMIFPRNKQALFWEGAAHPLRRGVLHPKTDPNPYLERGLDAALPAVRELLATAIVDAIYTGASFAVALEAAEKLIVEAARAQAPEGKTGNLKRDIHGEVYVR